MKATQKYLRTSPRKLRLVADAIRNLTVDQALLQLKFMGKRAAEPLMKTLNSAATNAKNTKGITADKLTIASIDIGDGPVFKRFRAVSRGQAHSIKKRTSHIKIELKEKK